MTDKELVFERFCEMWGDWWNVPISCPIVIKKEYLDDIHNFKVAGKMDKPLTLYTVRNM